MESRGNDEPESFSPHFLVSLDVHKPMFEHCLLLGIHHLDRSQQAVAVVHTQLNVVDFRGKQSRQYIRQGLRP